MTDATTSLSALPFLAPGRAPGAHLAERQRSFAAVLGQEFRAPGPVAASPQERAQRTAEQLVSITFIQPILKQLRETSRASPPFAPTQAERQFGALADAEVAHQIVRAARLPLVDRVARDLLDRFEAAVRAELDAASAGLANQARALIPGVPHSAP